MRIGLETVSAGMTTWKDVKMHKFNLTVENIVDDAHLDAIVDLINSEAYVSNISKIN